ncbi:hypothetical protein NFI96_014195 [Prochilodus magdalenae]|nr:hypothetical protein NFI96_014195 [Prochilodus magdalenae]
MMSYTEYRVNLILLMCVSTGCTLENREQLLRITAHTGGSVLLPCYCTDLQTTPKEFRWKRPKGITWVEMAIKSDQYRNRVQLFNDYSPGNLSLLISHLTEEDGGDYECDVKGSHIIIRLTVKASPRSLPFIPFALVTVIFLHIIVAVVYYTSRIKGCTLENRGQQRITAHTGGSVLLPCSCTDLQTKPEELIWQKENRNTQTYEEISRESGQYRNRVQLFNDHSPGNLSLLISHLTEEDGGDYQCTVKGSHAIIRLTVKGNSVSVISFSLIPVLLLLMVLGGVIYWRYRGRRQGQAESPEQQQTEREQKSQDDVTYSTIVLSRTPAAPTVIGIEDKAEYAVLKISASCGHLLLILPDMTKCYLLTGCTLVDNGRTLHITAYAGGAVLLPCDCTGNTAPETFVWKYMKTGTIISIVSDENRAQLFNDHSPGNLSLLISHLTEEDGGWYRCDAKMSGYIDIMLTVEGKDPLDLQNISIRGCTLVNNGTVLEIAAHTGGSILLPCYCTDLHTKPKTFTWKKLSNTSDIMSSESGQYRNRVKLVNDHSPGNLSLLISHLTEEDGGDYRCNATDNGYLDIRLSVKEPPQSLPFVPFALVTVIFLHIIVAVVYHAKRTKGTNYTADLTERDGTGRDWMGRVSFSFLYYHYHLPLYNRVAVTTARGGLYGRRISSIMYSTLQENSTTAAYKFREFCIGCTLENREQLLTIAAHTGGSVLLPCSCTDLQTKPEKFSWKKENRETQTKEKISSESEPLPFVPFALVTVIFLHIIVAVVYHTKRTKDPARVHYSTVDGDGAVSLE